MPLGKLDSDGIFVGTGKWNGPAAPRDDPIRVEPLLRHERQQAGYQLGAKLNRVPIDDPGDRRRLANANETMHDTRKDLLHGRGNIPRDNAITNGASAYRTYVAYDLGEKYGYDAQAGAALAYGAGNCDHHSRINARLHAPKLQPGEFTYTVGIAAEHMPGRPTGHTLAETKAPARVNWAKQADGSVLQVKEHAPTIVLDSWATGPAVRRSDSAFASLSAFMKPYERFDQRTGTEAWKSMLDHRYYFSPEGAGRPEGNQILRERTEAGMGFVPWNDVQVVNPRFAQMAQRNLRNTSRLSQEIMAAGAGREAYNLSVSQATAPRR